MNKTNWFRVYSKCCRCGQVVTYKQVITCHQCKNVNYCSESCCQQHKDNHRTECDAFNNPQTKNKAQAKNTADSAERVGGSPSCSDVCFYCQKESTNLLTCSQCKKAKYCNRDCQKRHFKAHKIICLSTDEKEEGSFPFDLTCCFCKGDKNVVICSRCKVSFCESQACLMHHNDVEMYLTKFMMVKSLVTGETLKRMEKIGFPSLNMLSPLLSDLVDEYSGVPARVAICLEIVGPFFHIFRPSVIVRDLVGQATHIIFHDKDILAYMTSGSSHMTSASNLQPSTMRRVPIGICLKPGNMIILLGATWHHFMDGTLGIRVDSYETVQFFSIDN
ncbi:uncharacterized protein LOC131944942 [Physella acuta]|uniref:uncharacterized protein LOC131944942 n=1 Tax=Physella acuta TaxID=109671 RepID=UPI0027DAFAF2|nr:uncharacterized protein LOC131944942 [Physella acuta]XP_059161828.1 uncharacterized protein LOC131944942 [Physella acuta]XP_059161829.1 uncharacterized protein LOC131944942 [Physella acuta]XP_059161830.1 uncharacterized protein LOC131944942 [Physella acuta]XP_059161831.1 uncharacterized protein LOC131944942 [Physella acuta]XP_059161833.1 uncharacterized protein LOC131944942 [Physella acuta]